MYLSPSNFVLNHTSHLSHLLIVSNLVCHSCNTEYRCASHAVHHGTRRFQLGSYLKWVKCSSLYSESNTTNLASFPGPTQLSANIQGNHTSHLWSIYKVQLKLISIYSESKIHIYSIIYRTHFTRWIQESYAGVCSEYASSWQSPARNTSHPPATAATHRQIQQTKQPREVRPPRVPPTISTIMVTERKEKRLPHQKCLPNANLLYLTEFRHW